MDYDLNSVMAIQQEAIHTVLQMQTQSVLQQLAQSVNLTLTVGNSAERSLTESADWMSDRLGGKTKDTESGVGQAAAQWQEIVGAALDGAQGAAQSLFRIVEAALQAAPPDVQMRASQLASQVATAFQALAQALDQQSTQISAEVGFAVYNDQNDDQIVRMFEEASRDASAVKDQFTFDMNRAMQEVDKINVEQLFNNLTFTDSEIDAAFTQIKTTEAGLQQYGFSINIDEIESVNEKGPGITREDRMERALDMLLSRQFLDPMTNQATKNNLRERPMQREQTPEKVISVKEDPSALYTRQWKDIPEMRQVCNDVLEKVRTEGREPTAVKEDINKRLIAELKTPTTEAGQVVNEALKVLLRKDQGDHEFFRTRRLNKTEK